MHDEILQLEARLRTAMLAGDVADLDALLDDRLMFMGPDGDVYQKEDDLEFYRTRTTHFTRIDLEEVEIELHESAAIVVVLANLAGVFKGHGFKGRNSYTRTWVRRDQEWRIVAGSVYALPPPVRLFRKTRTMTLQSVCIPPPDDGQCSWLTAAEEDGWEA